MVGDSVDRFHHSPEWNLAIDLGGTSGLDNCLGGTHSHFVVPS
jgi:hypothetical protein